MNINNIPTFLKAQSPQRLRRLMLNNNLKYKAVFKYDVMQDSKTGDWYAWYQLDAIEALEDVFAKEKVGDV
ncbi:hypothetical protein KDA08_05695 [Candidatus Saccharibacteria bacterium]|nr:hypothetical protein [Candidatus Saccharibacteria bacterium]